MNQSNPARSSVLFITFRQEMRRYTKRYYAAYSLDFHRTTDNSEQQRAINCKDRTPDFLNCGE